MSQKSCKSQNKHVTTNFLGAREFFLELGYFNKQSSITRKGKAPQEKIFGFFSSKLLKIALKIRNLTHR